MAQANFNIRGLARSPGVILRWRPCFFVHGSLAAVPPAQPKRMPIGLSEAIAVATRFGHLLDFPEHPHKGNAEADDNTQKQQREAGGCKHGEHP
jgi:hypothetical protein